MKQLMYHELLIYQNVLLCVLSFMIKIIIIIVIMVVVLFFVKNNYFIPPFLHEAMTLIYKLSQPPLAKAILVGIQLALAQVLILIAE